jgi:hypothetical protein
VATFEVVRRSQLTPGQAWSRLTDWEHHSGLIPFTTVTASAPADAVGGMFVARTSLGPLGFDDPMEITGWQPPTPSHPGECTLVKRGSFVRGGARLTVTQIPGGSEVQWHEEATLRFGGRAVDVINQHVGRLLFTRLLDRLLR